MKNTKSLFKAIIICATFPLATAFFTSCANGTSTTGSDSSMTSAPAATDTMSSPSSAIPDTSKRSMDTTRKGSM